MMNPEGRPKTGRGKSFAIGGAALVYFIMALEIVVMISPFAFFFYAVFNPILLGLNHSSMTRWLTAFFLPHMIVPPNTVLLVIRVLGSALFLLGGLVFLVCALQVYLGKLLKWGVAKHGLYQFIRHPQYSGLVLAGLGLTILWPRFLTLMFLGLMVFLYYVLAKDEERRMLARYPETYQPYLERTGMFYPRFSRKPAVVRPLRLRAALIVLVVSIGGAAVLGFGLRAYTVAHLPLADVSGIDVLALSPSELPTAKDLVKGVLEDSLLADHLHTIQAQPNARVLAYVLPVDYVMHGMIANTGEEWKLFQRHQTLRMITDYILHPIGHLHGGHMHHAGMPMQHGPAMYQSPMMRRRIIFVEVHGDRLLRSAGDDFSINVQRTPRFFVDIHLHTDEILQVKDTPPGTGWGDVPTPMF
jgi:protein-S-isoprenylcysteine O-methyltransferase Ste14